MPCRARPPPPTRVLLISRSRIARSPRSRRRSCRRPARPPAAARLLRQQHADLQPLLLAVRQRRRPAGRDASVRRIVSRISSIRSAASARGRPNSRSRGDRGARQGQEEVVPDACGSRTRSASGTCGRCRGRAIAASSSRVRSCVAAEQRLALVRPGLAGDDIHHRGLAGAVRADDRAHLARLDHERQGVQRPEAVEADGDAVEIEQRLGAARGVSSAFIAASPSPRSAARRLGPGVARDRPGRLHRADDALAAGTASPG